MTGRLQHGNKYRQTDRQTDRHMAMRLAAQINLTMIASLIQQTAIESLGLNISYSTGHLFFAEPEV